MRLFPLLLAAAAIAAIPVHHLLAQDVIKDVEYMAGKDGFGDKKKGELELSKETIRFVKEDGRDLIFKIPTASITLAERQTDVRDGSVGKKLLFGSLAGSRKQEFITLTVETSETAEAIVFKVKQNTGAATLAKINLYRKKAGVVVKADTAETTTKSNPHPPK